MPMFISAGIQQCQVMEECINLNSVMLAEFEALISAN